MEKGRIALYYSSGYGVIVADSMHVSGRPLWVQTIQNAFSILSADITNEGIGKAAWNALKRVETIQSVSKMSEDKYWYITGIKDYKKYSQTFSSVKVFSDDSGIHVEKMGTDKLGGYFRLEEAPIDLPADVAPEVLGETLLSVLRSLEPKKPASDLETIETILGHRLTYKTPGDEFEDRGDGHTDAYKVYCHVESEETMAAFMIDSGYKGYDEVSIREKWESWYGALKGFVYEEGEGKVTIRAKSSEAEIASYLYLLEGETVELMTTIDKTAFAGSALTKVRKQLAALAQSVRF